MKPGSNRVTKRVERETRAVADSNRGGHVRHMEGLKDFQQVKELAAKFLEAFHKWEASSDGDGVSLEPGSGRRRPDFRMKQTEGDKDANMVETEANKEDEGKKVVGTTSS
ncbi:hypothetical protein HAX54_001513 [Datura stramonium]|uniref:Uncharacterized protein n=1 Tax=Datura stramonium TaxID=4076 RepID=A0ABS8RSJ8_DATST|nr:hypothetical protein [Datura stramonium]